MKPSLPGLSEAAETLIARALAHGADAADCVCVEGDSVGVTWRLGKLEDIERSEGRDIGLRVFVGARPAIVSSSDTKLEALDEVAERAVAMAKAAPEDPYAGLADEALLAEDLPLLDIEDDTALAAEALVERARAAEEAALEIKGVTNSSGASASAGSASVFLATSLGFAKTYRTTSFSISCSVLAGEGTAMERDYDFSSARFDEDLDDGQAVGRKAGENAVKRLNPRKAPSATVPVVYDPRVSGGLISHFASAISGSAIARGTSFLKDAMEKPVFADGISIIDDAHRRRGLRSKPFDGEGVRTARRALVEDGTLKSWLLDCASARQLGLETTGNAARSPGGPPSPSATNLYLAPGEQPPGALIADIESGFYVTEMIGMGVNGVTGDYSRGASGFWIEKGEIAYPVSEVTVAGNLKEMFRRMTPADDLTFRYGVNAPTVRVEGMTVAGT